MKKIIIFAVLLFSFSSLAKAEEKKILDCSEALEVIKFSQDESVSAVLSKDGRIFVSLDQCASWFDVLRECFVEKILDIEIISEKVIFAVGERGLVIKTTDGGESWNPIPGLPNKNFTKVKFVNQHLFQYLYILGDAGTVLRSRDLGNSFENFSVNITGSFRDIVFKDSTDLGFMVSDEEPGLWVSIHGGSNWESHNLPQEASGTHISIDGRILYITGFGYMGYEYQSPLLLRINSDDLDDWMVGPLPESFTPSGVVVKNGSGAAIMNKSTGQVWRAMFNGMSWVSEPVNRMLYSIAMTGDDIYIASDSGFILRLDAITGISSLNSEIPSGYSLSQNYPNPFNPVTKINFSIPKSGFVKLAIFNIAGQEVDVLLNEVVSAGSYTHDFDGSKLSTGTYFYRIQADNFSETKRMILLK